MASFDHLNRFFEAIKAAGFWQRLFGWKKIRNLSYDAYEEFRSLAGEMEELNGHLSVRDERISELEKNKEIQQNRLEDIRQSNQKLDEKLRMLEMELKRLTEEKTEFSKRIAKYEESEENRKEAYEKNVTAVNTLRSSLEQERQQLREELVRKKEAEFQRMKETWKDHESAVESSIRSICSRNFIEYMEEVPFRGRPDNTIRIAGEFVIFDAKSPASDNLDNFPVYLKAQTEQVRKYIKHENVKKDLFLVIPSNTLEVVEQYAYNMGDYNVFVITRDSLEPIILSLKKIEEYEFAEQLSPEERDNICRIIGKFAHTAKRRIQLDGFFSYQFLEILTRIKADLPRDIYDMVVEFEKAEKLNPPQEKRAKQILTEDLIAESEKLGIEAKARLEGSHPEDDS
jgi:hypothetical protein